VKNRTFPVASEWFAFRNATSESVDLYIYDVIGEDWYGEGVTAKKLISQLAAAKGKKVNVRLNSPGGSVFDGVAIYNALVRHDGGVETFIDGLAASIASVIALAGSKVTIAENAMVMIHNPWTFAYGEASELRKVADTLDQVRETLLNTYETRTKKERKELGETMDAETWFTAQEAKAFGLVDEVVVGAKVSNALRPEVAAAFNFKASRVPVASAPEQNLSPQVLLSHYRKRLALHEKS